MKPLITPGRKIVEVRWRIRPEAMADETMFNKTTGTAYTSKKKKDYMALLCSDACSVCWFRKPELIKRPVCAHWVFQFLPPKNREWPVIICANTSDTDGLVKVPKDILQKSSPSTGRLNIVDNDRLIVSELAEKISAKEEMIFLTIYDCKVIDESNRQQELALT
jgi:Holliday junction resolvase RusA-like endonuclease